MIILTNCLSTTIDEGCVKVAHNLVKRLKASDLNPYVITYERKSNISDQHLILNKFFFNRRLFKIIKKHKQKVLYCPFPARAIATSIRIFVLSLFAKYGLDVVVSMQSNFDFVSKLLLKLSGAKFIVLSYDAYERFVKIVGKSKVLYLKTGVDTKKFVPVSPQTSRELKIKYGLDAEKPVVLHIGHLNKGRNISQLLNVNTNYQVLLVVSTLTKDEQDLDLRKELLSKSNIKIIDKYILDIHEIYQMSDVYLFPVMEYGRCIDVPLSCLEAASCNKAVITTDYGEMKAFRGKEGFYFIDCFDDDCLNSVIENALRNKTLNTRESVLIYDWDNAVSNLYS